MGAGADGNRSRREEFMDARRLELRLTWSQVAEIAGLHRDTLREFRAGRGEPNMLTKRGVEHALKWAQGSIDAIDNGEDPTPTGPTGEADPPRPPGSRRSSDGIPVDENGDPWTPERIWTTLQFVRESTEDPLAWYRAFWDAAQRWGIPPAAGNQSRQAG